MKKIKRGLMWDRLYVSVDYIDHILYDSLITNFTKRIKVFVSPQMCKECYDRNEGEVVCNDGNNCPFNYKTLVMFDRVRFNSGNYFAIWRGNIPLLMKVFKGFKVRDRRLSPRANQKIKFTGTLRDYQQEAAKQWFDAKYGGQIVAPARSGKTILGTYIASKLGLKTLVLTHQIDLLHQFYDTFEQFTNLKKLSSKVPPVVIAEKGNILSLIKQGSDIILSTYQTFLSKKGHFRFKQAATSFGLLIVDEAHLIGADGFSKIVTKINSLYKLGLTATPDRKDGRDVLAKFALGDVVSEVEPPQLSGKAIFIYTGTSVGEFYNWSTMLNRLSKNKRRNNLIIGYVLQDIKDKHKVVVVTERREQCEVLAKELKDRGIKVAILYGNIKNRKKLIEDIRAGKYDATIATRKLVRYGLNIPPWSSYHCAAPTNNQPNFYQEMSRVRTPHPGKNEPLVRYYVDAFAAAMACVSTCEKVLIAQKFDISKEGAQDNIMKIKSNRTQNAISRWNSKVK